MGLEPPGQRGMEKFRSPVLRAAAARKRRANGCGRAGREKISLEAVGDEASCHGLACGPAGEDKPGAGVVPSQEVRPGGCRSQVGLVGTDRAW